MAINLKDFKQTRYPNLYKSINKDRTKGYKYIMWAKIDAKLHKKVLGFSEVDKLTDSKANTRLLELRKDILAGYTSSDKIQLDKLFDIFSQTLPKNKRWTQDRINIYNRYITKIIGKKQLHKIRPMDIQKILTNMSNQGLSPRTQKSVLEVLKPLYKFATKNKYIKDNPTDGITVKVPNQKKIVTNATELFNIIIQGIKTYFEHNPFYQALFLFGFTGRRKGEILTLKWENIDLNNDYYWLDSENTKPSDNQKYPLPPFIKEQLLLIKDDRKGLVFKSPATGKQLVTVERQMNQLKKHTGIENLSLHYMRNVLVSALAEKGTEAIFLSGILGHNDINTINKYLSINHYKSGQEGLKKIDEILEAEIVVNNYFNMK